MAEIENLEGRSVHNLTKLAERELMEVTRYLGECALTRLPVQPDAILGRLHYVQRLVNAIHRAKRRYN